MLAGTPIVASCALVAGSHAANDRPKGNAGTAIASTRNHQPRTVPTAAVVDDVRWPTASPRSASRAPATGAVESSRRTSAAGEDRPVTSPTTIAAAAPASPTPAPATAATTAFAPYPTTGRGIRMRVSASVP
ncbi:hypothetical protein FK529_02165 [Tsukamurella asaccharolytica]|uniref:Uncharacterized protein n=1 Tax=Tsukamurella asaccharolytica TaxID=2592067 RepID=A0A5C5RFH0_9ACTN|nr:hypothetical protein FK529_02165 [Tsukamurella asaccharolytica]